MKKMKSKIVLFSVVAVLALFAVSAVPSASANGQDNEVYFVPEDSYGLYCENIPVLIMVDAVDLTTGAGMDIYFDPDCVNVTNVDFTGTPYSKLTDWTHEGNYVRIGVMGPKDPIQPGTYLIANLTLHCEKETECISNLAFAATELLDYNGDPLPNVIWHDGTFSCGEVPCIPRIEVNKTVWDNESQAWVDETTAQMSENVRFRCEIHNDGTCPLTGIVARDILSDSLEYADNATVNGEPMEPTTIVNPNEFMWEFPVFVLVPYQTITIEFDTHVIGYGYDCNVQSATAMWEEIEVSDEDTACVDVPNGQDNEVYFVPEDSYGLYCENIPVLIMVDAVDLTTGAGMDIYFDPDCVNVTNVDFTGTPYSKLTDWTHEGNYVRIGVMGPKDPIQPGTYLIANLTLHCEKETECISNLAFAATELLDYNGDPLPNVIWHDGTFSCGEVPCIPRIEVNKTVWDNESQAWVDETTAQMSENVRFRCEIHNDGTCPLTGIVARDILSDSLEYADNATVNGEPMEPTTIVNPNEFMWEFPVFVLVPYQTITIEFDTHVIGYGYDCNVQSATAMWEEIEVSDEDTACVDVPNGQDNEVYFVPEDSYGLYCENIPVLIMVDAVDLTTGAGMDIYFDPDCVNITNVDFTGTPYSKLSDWTHEGNYVRIGVMGPKDPIQPGTYLIANLTLHCENEAAECSSDLLFKATELLDDDGSPLPNVIWYDGTFTCVDKPDLNVTEITVNYDAPSLGGRAIGPEPGPGVHTECNNLSAVIEEKNGVDVESPFDVSFTVDGTTLCTVLVPGLTGGANKTVCCDCCWSPMAGDDFAINVTVDSNHEISETNERDNTKWNNGTVVSNGYKGDGWQGPDKNLENVQCHDLDTINLIYSVGDSKYVSGSTQWTEYTSSWTTTNLSVPDGANIEKAMLYVYYTWDKDTVMPDNVNLKFNDNDIPLARDYSDRKGFGGYNFPSGMLVYDVLNSFAATGPNNAIVTKAVAADVVSMRGMLLMVVYNHPDEPERMICIDEGYDMLYAKDSYAVTSEEATTYAPFTCCEPVPVGEIVRATLIAVAPSASEGDDMNRLSFNDGLWKGIWDHYEAATQLGIAEANVLAYLKTTENRANFQSHIPAGGDKGDFMDASNAFLIMEMGVPCPAKYAVYQANVRDPEGRLNELRALRDNKLDDGYVTSYYDNSPMLTLVLSKADSDLVTDGAQLVSKYSIPVGLHVQGMDVNERITKQDVEEALSFTERLKIEVMKNRDAIGVKSTEAIIDFIEEFEGEVKASEGKTFSAALKSSIYYEGKQLRANPAIVEK